MREHCCKILTLHAFQLSDVCIVFSPCQAGDGWGAEATGDWGAEESWESVDGNQGKYLRWHPFITNMAPLFCLLYACINQVSARPSCPRRKGRRGGKSWRQNGQSAKLLKVLSNWAHASWTDGGCKSRLESRDGEGGTWTSDCTRSSGWRIDIPQTKDQKEVLEVEKKNCEQCFAIIEALVVV